MVTRALLPHETRRKSVNDQADRLVAKFEPKSGSDKSLWKNDRGRKYRSKSCSTSNEESRSNTKVECFYCHKKWHHKRFCRVLKQDLKDKKNQKSFADLVSVSNDESDDSKVSENLFSISSYTDYLIYS